MAVVEVIDTLDPIISACDTANAYLNNYSGQYHFQFPTSELPDGAEITKIQFQFLSNAMGQYYSQSYNGTYGFYDYTNKSTPDLTENSSDLLTDTKQLNSSSNPISSALTWTVKSSYLTTSFIEDIQIALGRQTSSGSGNIAYKTVSSGGVSYKGGLKCTVTYKYNDIVPTLSTPSVLGFGQNNDGTFHLFWSSSTITDGVSGSKVLYRVYQNGSLISTTNGTTNISGTIAQFTIPGYNTSYSYQVRAYYSVDGSTLSSTYVTSNSKSYEFSPPTLSTSYPSCTPISGSEVEISWNESKISYGTSSNTILYTVQYSLNRNNWSHVVYSYLNSETLNEQWFTDKGIADGSTIYFRVRASLDNVTPVVNSSTIYSSWAETTFTYENAYTIAYYTGSTNGWQECIVHYYDGSEWVECIPYYYNNGWQKINTKIE